MYDVQGIQLVILCSSRIQTFPQVDLQAKWSLYHARMSFHRHELGMSWPSEILIRGMAVENGWMDEWVCMVRYWYWVLELGTRSANNHLSVHCSHLLNWLGVAETHMATEDGLM